MLPLLAGKGGEKKKEMEAFWVQLDRLKVKIGSVEDSIYELARSYSRLPLRLRNDSRISKDAREDLKAVFFDVDKDAQVSFWAEKIDQAKWIILSNEGTQAWCELMAYKYAHLKQEHLPPEGFLPLDAAIASQAIVIATAGLADVEKRVMKLRNELSAFSDGEKQGFYTQNWEDSQKCSDGATRFLYCWPSTEGWLMKATPKEDEEKKLGYLVADFMGMSEMVDVRPAEAEEEGITPEFYEDGDSGVFL
jgi:hypothetical protein